MRETRGAEDPQGRGRGGKAQQGLNLPIYSLCLASGAVSLSWYHDLCLEFSLFLSPYQNSLTLSLSLSVFLLTIHHCLSLFI